MKRNLLPKGARIHIRKQKALIRKTVDSGTEQEEKIKALYQKHIRNKKYN